jgi:hypothetical protein
MNKKIKIEKCITFKFYYEKVYGLHVHAQYGQFTKL